MNKLTSEVEAPVVRVDAVAKVQGSSAGAVTDDPRDKRIAELTAELETNPLRVRAERFNRRVSEGRLTFDEYKKLPKEIQAAYARLNGAPLADNEARRVANQRKKRTEKNKCARKSRRRNRS